MSKYRNLIAGLGAAGQLAKTLYDSSRAFRSFEETDSGGNSMARSASKISRRKRRSRRTSLASRGKRRTGSKTSYSRKRKSNSRRKFLNRKRNFKLLRKITRMNLSAQPYWIDSATWSESVQLTGPKVQYGGMAPIGLWSGYTNSEYYPYPNNSDTTAQFSDLTRIASKIGIFTGTSPGTFLDQGQLIKIDYSKVQYMIRNNANIAANLRMFFFKPKKAAFSLGPTDVFRFQHIMALALSNAGNSEGSVNYTIQPTDFPWFNKYFKIVSRKNKRLLPGENIYVSDKTCVNKVLNSTSLNTTYLKPYTKFFGFMVHGDPIHSSVSPSQVSLSSGHIDCVVAYKLKFRRLNVASLQNDLYFDNDLPEIEITNQDHVAAFANDVNPVDT